jgi:hypothetical protein
MLCVHELCLFGAWPTYSICQLALLWTCPGVAIWEELCLLTVTSSDVTKALEAGPGGS